MAMAKIALFVALAVLVAPVDAMAYIDPGVGNALMSTIIGLIVAGGLFFKTIWYKISSMFSRTPPANKKDKL